VKQPRPGHVARCCTVAQRVRQRYAAGRPPHARLEPRQGVVPAFLGAPPCERSGRNSAPDPSRFWSDLPSLRGGRQIGCSGGDGRALPRVDLALLPINGLRIRPAFNRQVVMTAEEAAELCGVLRPRVAVPIHYSFTAGPLRDRLLLSYDGTPERFKRSVATYVPTTDVRVLAPGEPLMLGSQLRAGSGRASVQVDRSSEELRGRRWSRELLSPEFTSVARKERVSRRSTVGTLLRDRCTDRSSSAYSAERSASPDPSTSAGAAHCGTARGCRVR
jgi:hypothetical protein